MFEEMTNASVLFEKKRPLHIYLFYSLIFDLAITLPFQLCFKRDQKKKVIF